jgi:hypothetical protein
MFESVSSKSPDWRAQTDLLLERGIHYSSREKSPSGGSNAHPFRVQLVQGKETIAVSWRMIGRFIIDLIIVEKGRNTLTVFFDNPEVGVDLDMHYHFRHVGILQKGKHVVDSCKK